MTQNPHLDSVRKQDPDPGSPTVPFERLRIFTYVQVDQAMLYRAILASFVEAKARFVLHLRPKEVVERLAEGVATDEAACERALAQLCDWGNLESHTDTADVATVEDFYKKRQLYRLTAAGEAAEHAISVFHQHLEQPGELQTAALDDIRVLLRELLQLAEVDPLDQAKVHRTLRSLVARFDELTRRSQVFLGSLQRRIDLQGQKLDDFLAYKEVLIGYLDRFVHELVLATADVVGLLRRLDASNPERLLEAAASRQLSDAVEASDQDHDRALDAWRQQWAGLTAWFVRPGGTSQAEVLRGRARSAIPALLNAVESLHDRRLTRSNRSHDLRTLARWFAECDTETDAHRLWRAAFGLTSSRHLRTDAATLERYDQEPVSSQTSWLDAPPIELTPRLRRTGRTTRRGRTLRVIDRRREKELLARLAAEEAAQIDAARRQLMHDEPVLLSRLGRLDRDAFALFLDLLGEALAHRVDPRERVVASSADGALEIVLEPLDEDRQAVLETPGGRFCGRDHRIHIRESRAKALPAVRVSATTVEPPDSETAPELAP